VRGSVWLDNAPYFEDYQLIAFPTGTSSIVDENTHEPILSILTLIVETAAKLRRDGHNVVLVSSGAVGVGLRRMDVEDRPKNLPRIQVRTVTSLCQTKVVTHEFHQALAAVGQCRLMSLWDGLFSHLRVPVAQILLTRNDIADVRPEISQLTR
jgi:glutamate 5-kinase